MSNRRTDETVSCNLRVLMAETGLPQTVAAQHAGMYQSGLSRSLNGHREWRVHEVVALAQLFGTTVEGLTR